MIHAALGPGTGHGKLFETHSLAVCFWIMVGL
jgi:hypothetical protein